MPLDRRFHSLHNNIEKRNSLIYNNTRSSFPKQRTVVFPNTEVKSEDLNTIEMKCEKILF